MVILPLSGAPQFTRLAAMVDFLRSEGVDTDAFDRTYKKPLEKLFVEQLTGQIEFDFTKKVDGKLRTCSTRARLKLRTPTEELVEVNRIYPSGKHVSQLGYTTSIVEALKRPGWSVSETMVFGETPIDTMIRGIMEELGLPKEEIPRDRLVLKTPTPLVDEHDSTVYPFVSSVKSFWYEWEITREERIHYDRLFIRTLKSDGNMMLMRGDEGVLIERQWRNIASFYD